MKKQDSQESPTQAHNCKDWMFFCTTCAENANAKVASSQADFSKIKIDCSKIVYCAKCNLKKHATHKSHKNNQKINSDKIFWAKFSPFIHHLSVFQKQWQVSCNQYGKSLLSVKSLDQLVQLFCDQQFVKWVISTKFWEYQGQKNNDELDEYLQTKVFKADPVLHPQQLETSVKLIADWDKFKIENSQFSNIHSDALKEKEKFKKQKQIVDLLIDSFSSFDVDGKKESISQIDEALKKYPNQEVLLIAKLYLTDLHKENFEEWQEVLKSLGSRLSQSPIYAYFESHKYWHKISNNRSRDSNNVIFVDNLNQAFYELSNPQQYVNLLSQRIIEKPCFILLASRGLGYIALNKYDKAIQDFQKASQTYESETFAMNVLVSKVKQNPNVNLTQILMSEIGLKSKSYIINAIKLLKRNKLANGIIQCCEILQDQGNSNSFVWMEYSKALLKKNKVEEAEKVFSQIDKLSITNQISQRFQRKKMYASARAANLQSKYDLSQNNCFNLLQVKKTASAFYSLASSYYNQQKWDESEKQILKAIELNGCDKYYKLLFHIYLMKKQLEQAKKLMGKINKNVVPDKLREVLNEYV